MSSLLLAETIDILRIPSILASALGRRRVSRCPSQVCVFSIRVGPKILPRTALGQSRTQLLTALLVKNLKLEVLHPERVRLSSVRGLRPVNLSVVAGSMGVHL